MYALKNKKSKNKATMYALKISQNINKTSEGCYNKALMKRRNGKLRRKGRKDFLTNESFCLIFEKNGFFVRAYIIYINNIHMWARRERKGESRAKKV